MNRILYTRAKNEIEIILKENLSYNLDGHIPNAPKILIKDVATLEGIIDQINKQLARTDLASEFRDSLLIYCYSARTGDIKAFPVALTSKAQTRFEVWDAVRNCAKSKNVHALNWLLKMQHEMLSVS